MQPTNTKSNFGNQNTPGGVPFLGSFGGASPTILVPEVALRGASRARLSNFRWQKERSQILQRLCLALQSKRNKGRTLKDAVRYSGWYWSKGRFYRNEPTRKVKLSRSSLIRHYYHWRKNGRCPEAFTLAFVRTCEAAPFQLVESFATACAQPGVRSMEAAFRIIDGKAQSFSIRTLISSLPVKIKEGIAIIHADRRKLHVKERVLGGRLKGWIKTV